MAFLGIDLGTSGLRALLTDDEGRPVGSVTREYPVANPHPGWSEQDPLHWTAALDDAAAELKSTYPEFAGLRGVGVAGHMHGATLLDGDGEVLRPCILWNDTRAHAEAAHLDAAEGVREASGNIVFPGFTAPKLLWIAEHEQDIFARTAKVLLPAAYLNRHLIGEGVTDKSDAAGTAWLDVGSRSWSDQLLGASGMRGDQMPRLVEGTERGGALRADLARSWGISRDVAVAGGAGDNAAAACGIGALGEGQGFVSLGTSGVILVARESFAPDPDTAVHTFCHAIPDAWVQMSVMLSATDCLNWLAKITGASPAELTGALGDALEPPGTVRFLPYLSGERTPHNDAAIRAGFTGISGATDQASLTRSVLEGVAYGLRDGFDALKATGARPESLIAVGGGARSDYWLRLVATVLGLPLEVPADGEFGAALGAARLGGTAATGVAPQEIMTGPETVRTIEPDPGLASAFEDAWQAHRAAYPAIRAIQ